MAAAAADSYTGYVQDKLGACRGAGCAGRAGGCTGGMQAPTPQAERQLLGGAGGEGGREAHPTSRTPTG